MNLKNLICKKGLTQTLLAKKLKVTQALVSKWVNGLCQPQIEKLPEIAKELNCELQDVVECFVKKQ